MASTPQERSLQARLAALTKWSRSDTTAGTAPARAAFLSRFEREVDPDGVLPPAERTRRADRARRAHMTRLALRSAQVRRRERDEL